MNKIRFFGLIVVLTLILGSVTTFWVLNSGARTQDSNTSYSERSDYSFDEVKDSSAGTVSQVTSLSDAGNGNLTPAGPTRADCFSTRTSSSP